MLRSTWILAKNELLSRFREVLLGPDLLASIAITVVLNFYEVEYIQLSGSPVSVAGWILGFSGICLAFVTAVQAILLAIPSELMKYLARPSKRNQRVSRLSNLVFLVSWSGYVACFSLLATLIVIIAFQGRDQQSLQLNTFQTVLIETQIFLVIYLACRFVLLLVGMQQLLSLYDQYLKNKHGDPT